MLDLMNGVALGGNDKEGEGGGQLAHRRNVLKDDDGWEYGYRGGLRRMWGYRGCEHGHVPLQRVRHVFVWQWQWQCHRAGPDSGAELQRSRT